MARAHSDLNRQRVERWPKVFGSVVRIVRSGRSKQARARNRLGRRSEVDEAGIRLLRRQSRYEKAVNVGYGIRMNQTAAC